MPKIFVAIMSSLELRKTVIEWEAQHTEFPVRWLLPENLHVTLIPPWMEENVDAVAVSLRTLSGTIDSFPIYLNYLSFGPSPKNPRLIWAEGIASEKMTEAQHLLATTLRFRNLGRAIRFHMTLARFPGEEFETFSVKKLDERVRWEDTARTLALCESFPNSQYEVRAEVSLV